MEPNRRLFSQKINGIISNLAGDDLPDILQLGMEDFTVRCVLAVAHQSKSCIGAVLEGPYESPVLNEIHKADVEDCDGFFTKLSDVVTRELCQINSHKPTPTTAERLFLRELIKRFFTFVERSSSFTRLKDCSDRFRYEGRESKRCLAKTQCSGITLPRLVEHFESHILASTNDFTLCDKYQYSINSLTFLKRLQDAVKNRPLWVDERCLVRRSQ